jgi:hypothetical protein
MNDTTPITAAEAVRRLEAIYEPKSSRLDREDAHMVADEVLLQAAPTEVAAAYRRLRDEQYETFWYA